MALITDLHSHLMPGVDDGAPHRAASAAALAAFAEAGVQQVVTTPHVDASLTRRPDALAARLAELDAAFHVLEQVNAEGPRLALGRGAEVMLDDPEADLADPRLRLNGGPWVLCEFNLTLLPPNSHLLIEKLVQGGVRPVIAHIERYRDLERQPEAPKRWRAAGAALQVNHRSLSGGYGELAMRRAWQALGDGIVSVLASDFHARGEVGYVTAREAFAARGALEQFTLMTATNPARIAAGESPLPVPPVR